MPDVVKLPKEVLRGDSHARKMHLNLSLKTKERTRMIWPRYRHVVGSISVTILVFHFAPTKVHAATLVEELGQPNIVVILTDDQGYGDLGCYGATDIETPNIDRALCPKA